MAVRTTRIPVRANPTARANFSILGMSSDWMRTPTQNLAHYTKEEILEWQRYMRCAEDNVSKGRPFYHPKGAAFHPLASATKKGIGTCEDYYKHWIEDLAKMGAAATNVATKRQTEGSTLPGYNDRLASTQQAATDVLFTGGFLSLTGGGIYQDGIYQPGGLSPTEQSQQSQIDGTLTEEELLAEEEGMSVGTMIAIGIGGLAVIGTAYYFFIR